MEPTPAPQVLDMLQTAFTGIKTDAIGAIGVILPIVLGIFAAVFAVKFGVKFFQKIGSKT